MTTVAERDAALADLERVRAFVPLWDGRVLTGRRGKLAWSVDSRTSEVTFRSM
jgi:hypothetical protein